MNQTQIDFIIELERRRMGLKLEKLLFPQKKKIYYNLEKDPQNCKKFIAECFEELYLFSRELQTKSKTNIENLKKNDRAVNHDDAHFALGTENNLM